MTGRELIIYILKNGLEDEPVFKDGKFIGFMTLDEAAAKMNVGKATVEAWTKLDTMALDSIKVVEGIYISENIFKKEPKTDEWNNKIGGRRT